MYIEPIMTGTNNRDGSWENKLEKFSQNAKEKKNLVTEYNRYREQNIET